jgi:hypothetical protein
VTRKHSVDNGIWVAWVLAGVAVLVQTSTNGRYGYFRDELYYLAASDHLAFGYVAVNRRQPKLLLWCGVLLGLGSKTSTRLGLIRTVRNLRRQGSSFRGVARRRIVFATFSNFENLIFAVVTNACRILPCAN